MKYIKIIKIVIVALSFSLVYAENNSSSVVVGEVISVDRNSITIKVSTPNTISSGDSVTLYIKTAFGDEVKTGECQVSSVDGTRVYATPRAISLTPSVGQIAKIATVVKADEHINKNTSTDPQQYVDKAKKMADELYKNSKIYSQEEIRALWNEVIRNIQKAISMDNAEAYWLLALIYEDGYGDIQRDLGKMIDNIMKSAEKGYIEAQYMLGEMYADGDEVAKDREQAIYWLKKAAEQGHKDAKYELKKLMNKKVKE